MDIARQPTTNTTRFILPLLFDEDVSRDRIITKDFKNTYVADIDNQDVDDYILVRYEYPYDSPDEYYYFDEEYYGYKKVYEKDGDFIYCFKLPDKFQDDYHLFLTGAYSKFSKEAKKRILNFWDANEDTLLHGILYKSEVGRKFWEDRFNESSEKWSVDTEYWFSPNMQKEILGFVPNNLNNQESV